MLLIKKDDPQDNNLVDIKVQKQRIKYLNNDNKIKRMVRKKIKKERSKEHQVSIWGESFKNHRRGISSRQK